MELGRNGNMSNERLYNDDALQILPTLPTASVDMVITDPPYILSAGSDGNVGGKIGTWGDMMNAAYWYTAWYAQCWRLLKPTGTFWTFCNWRSLPVVQKALFDARIPLTSLVVWDKEWIGPAGPAALRPTYELISMSANSSARIPDRSVTDLWRYKWMAVHSGNHHPAEKPERVIEMILQAVGLASGVILDPFMGSGTTGVVAVRYGFEFIGIEQDPTYFRTATGRIAGSQLQSPLLPNNGIKLTRTEAFRFEDDSSDVPLPVA